MSTHDTITAPSPNLRQRPIYGPFKRAKRLVLRKFGRWSRAGYDVQLVFEKERIVYKKIIFQDAGTAQWIQDNLQRFGHTEHLPRCRHIDGRELWMDYVEGTPINAVASFNSQEIARCFAAFAMRHSQIVTIDHTDYWSRHYQNLARLKDHGVLSTALFFKLLTRSERCCPKHVRIGFDYLDPIAPNLVQRADTNRLCAIDVKNWRADTLVGQGLAKASTRWLIKDLRTRVLRQLRDYGLDDIVLGFDFLRLYEHGERLRCRADTEFRTHGFVRKRANKAAKLKALSG